MGIVSLVEALVDDFVRLVDLFVLTLPGAFFDLAGFFEA